MKLSNSIAVNLSKINWFKTLLAPIFPKICSYRIFDFCDFHFNPLDKKGPSFHFAYDLEKGFMNYEEQAKNELYTMLKDGEVFYDIGANIGLYTIFLAYKNPNIKSFCFEPDPLAFECLSSTLSSFKSDQIKLFKKAIGHKDERLKLFKSSKNDGGHSLCLAEDEAHRESFSSSYSEVEVVNLDGFWEREKFALPNVIKIDVEGFELEVLKGMKEILRKSRPVLLVEANNQDLSERGELWSFFNSYLDIGIKGRKPGSSEHLSLEELSKVAKKDLADGALFSNFFFSFEPL